MKRRGKREHTERKREKKWEAKNLEKREKERRRFLLISKKYYTTR
jgi:hypothetical protein